MSVADVYQSLRSEMLSRHFAVGRHFPAYHFVTASLLGEWPACALPKAVETATVRCDTGACFPRTKTRKTLQGPGSLHGKVWAPRYTRPEGLLNLPSTADDPRQLIERWRVWRRDRTNPFLISALRISALCVEWNLGLEPSGVAVERWLETVESLFHFKDLDSPMAGYFLRYDAITSDAWESEIDSKGTERPLRPCEFLSNPDPRTAKERPYLYCTPTSDSRYRDAAAASFKGRDRYRHWEPSMDEITGLVVAHVMIFDSFQRGLQGPVSRARRDRAERVLALVSRQLRRVARYLQAHAYVLVRPCGGFTYRGASEVNPCLEYAFSCAFKHVLGEPFHVNATVEDAFVAAGVFDQVFGDEAGAPQVHAALIAELAVTGVPARLKSFLPGSSHASAGLGTFPPLAIKRAVQIYRHAASFDMKADSDQGPTSAGAQMALCYLLSKLARPNPAVLFKTWMPKLFAGEVNFKPLLGLIGYVTHDDLIVRGTIDLYGALLEAERGNAPALPPPSPPPPTLSDDVTRENQDLAVVNAIAVLVTQPDPAPGTITGTPPPPGMSLRELRSSLSNRLTNMAQQLSDTARRQPVLSSLEGGAVLEPTEDAARCCAAPGSVPLGLVFEFDDKVSGYHGFLAAAALAWRHSSETAGTAPWRELPAPTATQVRAWSQVRLPRALLDRADTERLPIPVLYRTGASGPDGIDLLADNAPRPPRDIDVGEPEEPVGEVHVLTWRWTDPHRTSSTETFHLPAPPAHADARWFETHMIACQTRSVRTFKAQLGDPIHVGDEVRIDYALESVMHPPLGQAKIDAELIISWVRRVDRST